MPLFKVFVNYLSISFQFAFAVLNKLRFFDQNIFQPLIWIKATDLILNHYVYVIREHTLICPATFLTAEENVSRIYNLTLYLLFTYPVKH